MKKILLILILGIAAYGFVQQAPKYFPEDRFFGSETATSNVALDKAFKNNLSDVQVGGSGKVVKILPDDTKGSRHQKFIVKLDSGQSVLVAHNIDIAPRIGNFSVGDQVDFYGEYEWNPQGGVVHWTHRDPSGRHEGGWLKHGGKIFQ
ncbi:DUF3465 domain-containing protein [Desulfopila sp. IMCC35006]|uniref:DUF3465 domain-containing protein n=1 Tax=Desulfopila sp. IMCC35006 TaxID=2569542 RepID=UPI0010AC4508|nr:DUF3465 domain-containing protein [Desulfopila sp. IMCC35006]TKB23266.1 DUF3465 domain-containing protein [Desulfopila sp. IMCC35006]